MQEGKMKKQFLFIMLIFGLAFTFFSCSKQENTPPENDEVMQQQDILEADEGLEYEEEESDEGINGSFAFPDGNDSTSPTSGERKALEMAHDYLNYTAFSRSGLIEQLEYEGFSHSEAEYAVENCGADWNGQAAKSAQSYLDYTSFSRSGLIDQLIYEGFTYEQAEYGVSKVY